MSGKQHFTVFHQESATGVTNNTIEECLEVDFDVTYTDSVNVMENNE